MFVSCADKFISKLGRLVLETGSPLVFIYSEPERSLGKKYMRIEIPVRFTLGNYFKLDGLEKKK